MTATADSPTRSIPVPIPARTDAERIPVRVYRRVHDVNVAVASEIAELIRGRAAVGRRCVLGLATGSTPTGIYEELVRLHRQEGLSFRNVVTFNLDEYFPMRPEELQSYRRFMREHLFDHVDIDPANAHVPDGTVDADSVGEQCEEYERRIDEAGGIDLQLLGIGRTGHVGFNEPGSGRQSRTRLITLDRVTRKDAASDFFGEENVPLRAITMGVGTILKARRVLLVAFGEGKAPVVARAVEGPVTESIAASFLQEHSDACVVLDRAAAADLTRIRTPWMPGPVAWDERLVRKAVVWLARRTKKAILKLVAEDYNEHHLQELLAVGGRAYDLNLRVFRELQKTITGWPGGKPGGDGPFPKRVVVFSPHPDDDVVSMGGTLIRLADQGHEVHVAYQTSGNIAVSDADALRFADFAADFNRLFGFDGSRTADFEHAMQRVLRGKRPATMDSEEVRQLKGLIRRGEARAAGLVCGVPEGRLHFMDLPFYETGRVRKAPLGEEDLRRTVELLREIRPHQVYAAGDLSDPHGTHRTCLAAVFRALERCRQDDWFASCETWLYRGAWQEWEVEDIDRAVPLAPDEVGRKRAAIFRHQSQKDRAMFPGADDREFWQRAEDRNRSAAQLYDALGLAEYEAIEAFVRWNGEMLD